MGGIPEVVVDGETGRLVDYDEGDPATFESELAAAVNAVAKDEDTAAQMGNAGRERALAEFSWARIAQETVDIYAELS